MVWLARNERFQLGIGLVLFVVRVRVEIGADFRVFRFLLLLYIENMDIEILSYPKIWLA